MAEPDERAARLHACSRLPEHGVSIRRAYDLPEGVAPGWVLEIYREATDEDLEEYHHLEQAGDLIWSTCLEIRHCPFCGEQLLHAEWQSPPSAPKHYDYSSWRMKKS